MYKNMQNLIKGVNLRSNGLLEFPHKLNPIEEVASINEFHHEEKSVLEEVGEKVVVEEEEE